MMRCSTDCLSGDVRFNGRNRAVSFCGLKSQFISGLHRVPPPRLTMCLLDLFNVKFYNIAALRRSWVNNDVIS